MNKDTHVYCSNCINSETNLKCVDEWNKNCKECKCIKCDCFDTEDSKPFSDRPSYESI